MLERKIIGITGSIGVGKSTILRHLSELGYPTIDADLVVHAILSEDDTLWAKLVTYFGDEIIDDSGNISRSALARIVFSDIEELRELETMLHPLVLTRISEMLEALDSPLRSPLVFIEATMLLSSSLRSLCGEVWLVQTDPSTQTTRLIEGRHYSETEVEMRVSAVGNITPPDDIPYQLIDNSGAIEYTLRRVQKRLNDIG